MCSLYNSLCFIWPSQLLSALAPQPRLSQLCSYSKAPGSSFPSSSSPSRLAQRQHQLQLQRLLWQQPLAASPASASVATSAPSVIDDLDYIYISYCIFSLSRMQYTFMYRTISSICICSLISLPRYNAHIILLYITIHFYYR